MEEGSVRNMGLAIFFIGLILLGVVFITAYRIFQDPTMLNLEFPEKMGEEDTFPTLFENIIKSIVYIGSLWIMGSISSRICTEGIKLYKKKE